MNETDKRARAQARREYFAQLRKRLGVPTLSELAQRLDLTTVQIYNLGRVDRHAQPALLEKLRQLAPGLDPTPLAAPDHEAPEPTLIDEFSRIGDPMFAALQDAKQEFQTEVQSLFAALGEHDYFFMFSLDEIPLELNPAQPGTTRLMLDRIQGGASFLYCVPSPTSAAAQVVRRLTLRSEILALDEPATGLLQRVKARLPERSEAQLSCVQISDYCPFFVPGFKFVLFLSQWLPNRCVASVGFSSMAGTSSATYLHARLSGDAARSMALYLLDRDFGQLAKWALNDPAKQDVFNDMLAVFESA